MDSTESTIRIPARSRRQAMDWSLVLVSQGIETAVEVSADSGWALTVPSREYERALAILRQYRAENRGWRWPKSDDRAALFDWASLVWVLLVAVFFWLAEKFPLVRDAGIMSGGAVGHGEWWRLFTAVFLHADFSHFLANAGIGFVLLALAMGAYGGGVGLLAAYLTGALGNVADWMVHPGAGRLSLGASGMVMGCIGLLAVQSVATWRNDPRTVKFTLSAIAAGLMLFVFVGVSPGTNVVAHFGGFVSGLLLGAVLKLNPRLSENSAVNGVAGALFAVLVILPWWLALKASAP